MPIQWVAPCKFALLFKHAASKLDQTCSASKLRGMVNGLTTPLKCAITWSSKQL
jgi:hypothetical protein